MFSAPFGTGAATITFFTPAFEVGVQLFRRAELAARLPYDAHAEVAPSPPI